MKLEKKICEHFELCDSSLNPDDEDATFETEDHTLTAGLVTEARKKCIHDFITLHERKEFSLEGWKIETQVYATGEDKEWPIPEDYIPIFKDLGYEDMFQASRPPLRRHGLRLTIWGGCRYSISWAAWG